MYTEEKLKNSDYFSDILKVNKIEYVVDSLTGLINRKYMLEYIKHLIDNNIPFSMAIVDLDDFKSVNDKYGHATGDYVLEHVASDLINFVGDIGLVGRFGGDEFIIVLFGKNSYDLLHDYFDAMYHTGTVFRKKHNPTKDLEIYVTGTIGCALYPDNAKDFNELFLMADKTLYRGKTKGRNCYIIYVHEKHKDLVIQKMHNDDVPTMMSNINIIFNSNVDNNQKIMEISEYIRDNLNLNNIFFIDKHNCLYDICTLEKYSERADMSNVIFKNERAQIEYRPDVLKLSFGQDIKQLGLASLLMTRLKHHEEIYGYLIFAIKRNGKVWETNEISTLMYYANAITLELLSYKLEEKNNE